jgi:GT2 family glycosyltransferase
LPSPRRAAVLALLLAAALGLAAVLFAAGRRSGGIAFSNGVVVGGFAQPLAPGATACSGPLARLAPFDRVRLSLAGQGSDPRREARPQLLVSVRDGAGRPLAAPSLARISRADAARDFADARLAPQRAGGALRVCLRNAGSARVLLWAGVANPLRAGATRVDGRPAAAQPELLFYRDPVPSLLAHVPQLLRRAAIWRPALLGTWTSWALALLVALGVPALLALALARSGEPGNGERSPRRRWLRFLAEVEPALAAAPRVHRFAQAPLLGEPTLAPAPLAVAIVGEGDGRARTRASLDRQSHAPAAVLEGDDPAALLHAADTAHVLLVEAGDTLAPLALERLGQALALAPDAHVLTCDHDRVDAKGRRSAPRLLPGPSPDLLLAHDASGAALCVERRAALGALAAGTLEAGAWRYDLALRLAGAGGERHAHAPGLFVHRRADAPAADADAELRAAARALASRDPQARVEPADDGARRVRRTLTRRPSVEAIVLFRDKPALLRRCVRSLLERSTYERLTVRLLDNGSVDPETAVLVAELARDPRVVAMADDGPFNFAALNNAALAASRAEVVVFLNNDTAVIDEDWVEGLLEEALRPDVGAVAPLLLYPDGSVQHAGAALGLHGYAGHPFASLRPREETPFGRASDGTRNWLAVTAACMMVERAKLDAVGRFDETFVVAGNDVDLCLRLTEAGHRSLCVPHVRLLHDESQSRGTHVDSGDFARSEARYGAFRTVGDPFYNPYLTLTRSTCELRPPGE